MILPMYENIAMAIMRRFFGALGLSRGSEIEHADTMIRALNIRPADASVEAGTLSGGNQQKVVLAKWLSTDANVFLFDEPTQGVDVGAKNEIHDIVRNLAARGKAVLIASSDLEEVLAVADRVLAMRQGRIVAEFSGAAVKGERFGRSHHPRIDLVTAVAGAASLRPRVRIDAAVIGPGLALAAMIIVYSVLSPHFLTVSNFTNVLVQCSPLLILAAGQTFPILMGGLDLSQGSIVSLVSVVTAGVMLDHGLGLGAIAGIGSGVLVGLANGILIGRFQIQPFIVTLGMLYMIAGAAMVYSGGSSVFGLPEPDVDRFFWFGGGFLGPIPVPLIIAAILIAISHLVLTRTPIGRSVYAVGGNEQVALMSGINVGRTKIFIYLMSGAFASIAGFVLSGRVISGQPILGAGDLLLQSIGAVIIGGTSIFGGRGGVLRSALGVFVVAFMVNGLNLLAISTFIQEIIVGAIIILSVWLNSLHRSRSRKRAA